MITKCKPGCLPQKSKGQPYLTTLLELKGRVRELQERVTFLGESLQEEIDLHGDLFLVCQGIIEAVESGAFDKPSVRECILSSLQNTMDKYEK